MPTLEEIKAYIKEGSETRNSVDPEQLMRIGSEIGKRLLSGSKLLIMGNGGSAADSQHFAAELVCRFEKERKPLSAFALTTDTSAVTAISNDYAYPQVFARQIKAHARKGDIVFGISTSGNSENVINGIEEAGKLGCYTITLTGNKGKLRGMADENISIAHGRTAVIQESHIMVIHLLSKIIEDMVNE
jgi:D-sedoheptulose 7-phosphate isomerase